MVLGTVGSDESMAQKNSEFVCVPDSRKSLCLEVQKQIHFWVISKMRLHYLALFASVAGLGSLGCSRDPVAASPAKLDVGKQTSLAALSTSDQRIGTFYLHDFGKVLPGQVSKHRFSLTNTTDSPWTFAKLIPSCSCTVASTSAQTIAPSKTETVEVEYKAPKNNGDDRRKVGVQFAETGSPMFWLEVKARVRQPMSFFPEYIALSQVGKDVTESFFEIHNYTSDLVKLEAPRCSEPWLEAELRPIEGTSPDVKQVWRVVVRAKTQGLRPGRHADEILITESGTEFQKRVPVEIDLVAPIRPIPNRLFFGSLERNRPVEKKLSLLLSSDVGGLTADDIQINHDLGDRLKIRGSRSSNARMEITATLTPPGDGEGDINGTIKLTFRDPSFPTITIPVIAAVNP